MAEDITTLHRWLIPVEKMQIRTADCACCDFDNRISWVFNFWIGDGIYAYVALSVPAKCPHDSIPFVRIDLNARTPPAFLKTWLVGNDRAWRIALFGGSEGISKTGNS
jgi:hypothetical protein